MTGVDWLSYKQRIGDRTELFRSISNLLRPSRVLYLGSYVDLSPSMVWRTVTYVDIDKRARKFFADEALVTQQLQNRIYRPQKPELRFVYGDFNSDLPLAPNSFDLVISLYSGPSLEAALRYLAPNGALLTNNSHADSSLAIVSGKFKPLAVVLYESGQYLVRADEIDDYFTFKSVSLPSIDSLMSSGRGAPLVKPNFAHLFSRSD
jgi:hypothetical protein